MTRSGLVHGPQSNGKSEVIVPSSSAGEDETRRVFHLKGVTKGWAGEDGFILTVPELTICRGEKLALVGSSGCGKSTLLDLLAMVLRPDKGTEFMFFPDQEARLDVIEAWKRKDLNALARNRLLHIGYVLQTGGLLPFISVRNNIGLSRQGLGLPVRDRVEEVAERLGIGRHLDKFPKQLSVGERQRVAIARAMAHEPSVVIADEPTASLDPITAEEIMTLFTTLADAYEVTLILATHEWEWVEKSDFRSVRFNIEQDNKNSAVRSTVVS